MAFRDIISLIQDGESVNQATANRPLSQLQENIVFLKGQIDLVANGATIIGRNVLFDSTVLVGQPVYYNAANAKFEKAQAIAGKEDCIGLCKSKDSNNVGEVLLAGRDNTSLANAFTGTVVAGRYFLDTVTAGKITNVRPATIQISVLLADGVGNIVVLPHENRSIPGSAGPTGPTGPIGPAGPTGPAAYLFRQKDTNTYHIAGQMTSGALVQFAPTVDRLIAVPVDTMQGGNVNRIIFEVTLAGNPGSDVRIGLYSSTDISTGNLYPSARLAPDFGGVNCTAPGIKTIDISPVVNLSLNSVVWLVMACGSASPEVRGIAPADLRPLLGTTNTFSAPGFAYDVAFAYTALPTTFPGGATIVRSGNVPALALRFSS